MEHSFHTAYAVWCNFPKESSSLHPNSLNENPDVHSVFIFEDGILISVYRLPWIKVLRLTDDLDKIGYRNISPDSAKDLIEKQDRHPSISAYQQYTIQLALETSKAAKEQAEWNLAHFSPCETGETHFEDLLKSVQEADAVYTVVQAFAAMIIQRDAGK